MSATDELASHGHLVRTWNKVQSGTPKVYRNGKWVDYTDGIFKPSGVWVNNGGTLATSPQNGCGDPAGTTDEMPSHSHTLNRNSNSSAGSNIWILVDHEGETKWQTGNVGSAGGDAPHNNIPPVIASYGWRRTD